MPLIKTFTVLGPGATAPAVGAVTDCKAVPTLGARIVIWTAVAGNSNQLQAPQFLGGTDPIGALGTPWFAPNPSSTVDFLSGRNLTNGGMTALYTTAPYWPWAYTRLRLVGNAGASPGFDVTGLTIICRVYYDGNRDIIDGGQENAVAIA